MTNSPRKRILTAEQRSDSFRKWETGVPVAVIAEKLGFAPSTIQRSINRIRGKRFRELEIRWIYNADFESDDAERVILGQPPRPEQPRRLRSPSADLPVYLASMYRVPLLTAAQETYWFRRMNYVKYLASRAIKEISPTRPSARKLDRISDWLSQSEDARNLLIRSNLRLVVSISRKYSANPGQLFDRISEGNQALLRAVELFDYGRGFRLSTYATWVIRRNLSRERGREIRQHERFSPAVAEFFDSQPATRTNMLSEQLRHHEQRQRVSGFDDVDRPQTLREIGVRHGVSKERVRQIELRALNKLREIAAREQPELIDILSA
jgi:RNA polymerase sigma factor (sigma-70 family)